MTDTRRQLNIQVSGKLYDAIAAAAAKERYTVSTYAGLLFQAAASERLKPGCAPDLHAAVGRVALLWGSAALNSAEIAATVGLSEPTVLNIIDAWKAELSGKAAA